MGDLGSQFWTPSKHESLNGYLQKIPDLQGYRIPLRVAEYGFRNETMKVVNEEGERHFLKIPEPERPELRLWIPKMSMFETGLQRAGFMKNEACDRIIKYCTNKFANSGASEEAKDDQRKALQEVNFKHAASEARQTGDIKEFKDVSEDKIKELCASLRDEKVPDTIVNAIERGTLMKKNTEAVFDLKFANGKLEHTFALQIITMRQENGTYAMLMAHYQLSFSSSAPNGASDQVAHTMTIDQMAVLQKYVETCAALFWKQKANDILSHHADDFLGE